MTSHCCVATFCACRVSAGIKQRNDFLPSSVLVSKWIISEDLKMTFLGNSTFGLFLLFTLLALVSSCNVTDGTEKRSVERRATSDDSVELFLRQTLTNLKSVMSTGFPQFGLPPLDPLRAGDVDVNENGGSTKIQAKFTNLLIFGLSNFEIRLLRVSRSRLQMDLELLFKNLTTNGRYNMTGKVAKLFPIYGHGRFEAEATNVVLTGMSSLKVHSSGRLSIRDLEMDMTVDKVKAHFHDLLGGGMLSGTANRILNLFGKKIFNDAKPKLLDNLKAYIQKSFDNKLEDFDASGF